MGWEAERAEDAYWMHGGNWPFDDSDYSEDTDEDPWRADERHAAEEDAQPVPDDPSAAEHLDEIMDAFHGLPDGTTRRVSQRAERARKMTGFGADEYAQTRSERARRAKSALMGGMTGDELREYVDAGYQQAAREGHGGWRPGKTVSVGFPMIHPMMLLDALAKAGLGLNQEPSRFPSEPPEGSVLKWVKTFRRNPEQGYTYVALHVNGGWYLTGQTSDRIDFTDLVKLIGDSPCELATEFAEIPQLDTGQDDVTPSEWYLRMFPQDYVPADTAEEGQG